ncbi:MAG: tRNA lysidine(34) synthetase TilS [bacterium]|nr:tRNA lysidine(34) synthetase TilS [bacterium]
MKKTVEKFLKEYEIDKNKTFLVGFSGGCDSLCLLDILLSLSKEIGFKLVALHLNHNWRGEESMAEMKNCEDFCNKNGIEFVSKILSEDVKKSENSAREERYKFFVECSKKYENPIVLTAHTASDNAETLIYRMVKGTGINGLQGIKEKSSMMGVEIYRPLLSFSRVDTQNYCYTNNLVPNNDSSNFDINYNRNFIRHKILPLCKCVNEKAEQAINSLSKLARSSENIIDEYVSKIEKTISLDCGYDTQKFIDLSLDVKRYIVLRMFLNNGIDYNFKKIERVLEFIEENSKSNSGLKESVANDYWIYVNKKYFSFITDIGKEKNQEKIVISGCGEYKFCEYVFSVQLFDETQKDFKFPKEDENVAYVNLDFDNLVLRTRRDGDIIQPFGMTGTMKLKKYLNSKGVEQHKKNSLVFLCRKDEVLWACGIGLNEKLKVVSKIPKYVLKLDK